MRIVVVSPASSRRAPRRWLAVLGAFAAFASLLVATNEARAQDAREQVRSFAPIRERVMTWEGERPERAWQLDAVVGFGTELPAGATLLQVPEALTTTSFAITGIFQLFRGRWTVWFRVPFTVGTFTPHWNADGRTVFSFGNFAVESGRIWPIARDLGIRFTFLLSCPTIIEKDALTFGSGYLGDAALVSRAASASRGFENPELLEPGLASLTPTLGLVFRRGPVRLEGYGKLLNFIDASNQPAHRYHAAAVVGARAHVRVAGWLDVGARLWSRLPVLWSPDRPMLAAAAELRARVTGADLMLGAVVPLYVATGESRVYGVSLGVQFAL